MHRFSLLIGIALLCAGQLVMIPISQAKVQPVLADPSGDFAHLVRAAGPPVIEPSHMGNSGTLSEVTDPVPHTTQSTSMRTVEHAGEDPNRIIAGALRPLVEVALPSAPMGGGTSLSAARLTYEPGASLVVRRHTQMRLVSLEAGALEIEVNGVAALDRLVPYGGPLSDQPVRVSGHIPLYPGDLLIIPVDAAFTARNAGEVPAVSLEISLQYPQPLTPMTDRANASGQQKNHVHRERLAAAAAVVTVPGQSAVVTIDRHILPPSTSMDLGKRPGTTLFMVKSIVAGTDQNRLDIENGKDVVRLVAPGERPTIQTNAEAPLVVMVLTVIPTDIGTAHQ